MDKQSNQKANCYSDMDELDNKHQIKASRFDR